LNAATKLIEETHFAGNMTGGITKEGAFVLRGMMNRTFCMDRKSKLGNCNFKTIVSVSGFF